MNESELGIELAKPVEIQQGPLKWFLAHVAQIRYLYLVAITFFAVPPIAEFFLRIGPPQLFFTQRVFITSMLGFLPIVPCYAYLYDAGLNKLKRPIVLIGTAALALFVIYVGALSTFSIVNDLSGERVAIGTRYKPHIQELLKSQPELTSKALLQNASWDARAVWVDTTVSLVENFLLLVFTSAVVGVSLAFSIFCLQQDKRLIASQTKQKKKK